jgi:hypothetical protein
MKLVANLTKGAAALTTILFMTLFPEGSPGRDLEQDSGLAAVKALADKFAAISDTNSLARLAELVDDQELGAKAAATLRTLSSRLTSYQVATIVLPALANGLTNDNKFLRREAVRSVPHLVLALAGR